MFFCNSLMELGWRMPVMVFFMVEHSCILKMRFTAIVRA